MIERRDPTPISIIMQVAGQQHGWIDVLRVTTLSRDKMSPRKDRMAGLWSRYSEELPGIPRQSGPWFETRVEGEFISDDARADFAVAFDEGRRVRFVQSDGEVHVFATPMAHCEIVFANPHTAAVKIDFAREYVDK